MFKIRKSFERIHDELQNTVENYMPNQNFQIRSKHFWLPHLAQTVQISLIYALIGCPQEFESYFTEESVGKTIEFQDLGICTMYLPIRQRETWVNLALSLCACISVMIACDLLAIKVSAQGCRNVKNLKGDTPLINITS